MRIDNLKMGDRVLLRFHGLASLAGQVTDEVHMFSAMTGTGDDREATFEDYETKDQWTAYRFGGRWAYGTSAERLSLIEFYPTPSDDIAEAVNDLTAQIKALPTKAEIEAARLAAIPDDYDEERRGIDRLKGRI